MIVYGIQQCMEYSSVHITTVYVRNISVWNTVVFGMANCKECCLKLIGMDQSFPPIPCYFLFIYSGVFLLVYGDSPTL